MKTLWAPWRIEYIRGEGKTPGCIFCDKPKETNDRANLILYRGKTCYMMMNRYPYSNGHIMVLPLRHTKMLEDLTSEEKLELMDQIVLGTEALKVFSPDGFNIGMNLGRAAGAGIEDHLHFHVVPRWSGDTNFMPVIGDVRVIPEYLEETYTRLAGSLESLIKRRGSV
ncbi:MAG: HIT domain-containing protein [Candidatus Methanosuratincola sp.]|jgi:ATP adenylyltransferase